VLVNLYSNALKYTLQGSITLNCVPEGEDRVRFEVHDTGLGIKEEN
jgi:signal transduction histidine kinase